jgi:hypothetical protein
MERNGGPEVSCVRPSGEGGVVLIDVDTTDGGRFLFALLPMYCAPTHREQAREVAWWLCEATARCAEAGERKRRRRTAAQ